MINNETTNCLIFHGACEEVTGSAIELRSYKHSLCMDYGAFQGRRDDAYIKNSKDKNHKENAKTFDFAICTHSHIDHSGMFPKLVKNGYRGEIFSTRPTFDLCRYMLPDSLKVMTKDLPIIDKQFHKKQIKFNVIPLYSEEDVSNTLNLFKIVPLYENKILTKELDFTLHDSCHILGSVSVEVNVQRNHDQVNKVFYTSDIGGDDKYLTNNLVAPKDVTHLIIETTYGDKTSIEQDIESEVSRLVKETINNNGKVIVPTFSVGRMQTMILLIHKLMKEGKIPNVKVYVDSPLGIKVTHLYDKYKDELNHEFINYFESDGLDPFNFSQLTYVKDAAMTKEIANSKDSCIVLSASGMASGGPIRGYLKDNIMNKNNLILQVGYASKFSLLNRIMQNDPVCTIDGEVVKNKCRKEYISGFSAHVSRSEIINYIKQVNNPKLVAIYLIHGEHNSTMSISSELKRSKDFSDVNIIIPKKGIEYSL